MRKIKILKINATSGTPGSIEVAGDFTQVFQGKFYRDPTSGATLPFYTLPAPADKDLIKATTFEVIGNSKYAGRYTVYTQKNSSDSTSSSYTSPKTTIRINETIQAVAGSEPPSLSTDGYVTNISTYLIDTGTGQIVVPPATDITSYPIELMGRDSTGWGEGFAQNFVNVTRNFANSDAPANPFVGQTWYDSDDQQLRVWNGVVWELVNKASYGVTFKHTQGSASATWTVNHMLGLQAPYIAFVQFFVDRGNGPKLIIPSDVSFDTANRLTVTFSNAEIGYVLVRQ